MAKYASKTRKQKIEEYNLEYGDSRDLPQILNAYLNSQKNPAAVRDKVINRLKEIEETREYKIIHITMYEYVMKTDRPRVLRNGTTYTPNAKSNKDYFRDCIKKLIKEVKLINTPAEIDIDAYIKMPKAIKPDEVILFELGALSVVDMPDYDNIGKSYTDMLTDVLILDDDIFYRGQITKYYSLLPRVEITITFQSKHDSEYVFSKLKKRKSVIEALSSGMMDLEFV